MATGSVIGMPARRSRFPYGDFWEAVSGPAIYRNVIFLGTPGENAILDQYGPAPGSTGAISVQYGLFDGDYMSVFLAGWTDSDIDRVIKFAEHPEGTARLVEAESARQAFKAGYLIPTPATGAVPMADTSASAKSVDLPYINGIRGQSPIEWADQIGRPVMDIMVSPDGRHILTKQHGMNTLDSVYTVDGHLEHSTVRSLVNGTPEDDVAGVDNDGSMMIDLADGHRTSIAADGTTGKQEWTPLWQSADDTERLFLEPYTAQQKGSDGKLADVVKHKLVRVKQALRVLESTDLGDLPGGITASPDGKYLWQANAVKYDGRIGPQTVVMFDAVTGKQLWTKSGWWIFSTAWSSDGEYVAVVRHYNNVDKHGIWAEPSGRCTVSMVRAADGEVVAEGYPTTWVDHMLIASDNSFAVGVPAYMATHIWLLRPGQDMAKIDLADHWLYTVALSGSRIYSLDMTGTLRYHEPTGKTIWSSDVLKRPWGADLGIIQPLGNDIMVGTYTGRVVRIDGQYRR